MWISHNEVVACYKNYIELEFFHRRRTGAGNSPELTAWCLVLLDYSGKFGLNLKTDVDFLILSQYNTGKKLKGFVHVFNLTCSSFKIFFWMQCQQLIHSSAGWCFLYCGCWYKWFIFHCIHCLFNNERPRSTNMVFITPHSSPAFFVIVQ